MTKKILCCFDGSGCSPEANFPAFDPKNKKDSNFSNILRFHLLAGGSIDDTADTPAYVPGQISLYQRGVGAKKKEYENDGNAVANFFSHSVYKTFDYYWGCVKEDQVNPMYSKLQKVYQEGDQIYILGFSRGSAAARLFTSKITSEEGINGVKPNVEFLGCFDTVLEDQNIALAQTERNSAGFPPATNLNEVDGQISTTIKKAVHCVSLDDERFENEIQRDGVLKGLEKVAGEIAEGGLMKGIGTFGPFAPTLMGNSESVTEVWFPGVHPNIGGGLFERGLSDTTFDYMKNWLENLGRGKSLTFLNPDDVNDNALQNSVLGFRKLFKSHIPLLRNSLRPYVSVRADDVIYDGSGWGSYRHIDTVKNDKSDPDSHVNIHQSFLERKHKMKGDYKTNPHLGTDNHFSFPLRRCKIITELDHVCELKTAELQLLDLK